MPRRTRPPALLRFLNRDEHAVFFFTGACRRSQPTLRSQIVTAHHPLGNDCCSP
jgi:hypothetical protein